MWIRAAWHQRIKLLHSSFVFCRSLLTIFPYEGEAQLEHLACIAVRVARAEAGQELWRHAGNGRVDVDGGEYPVALGQQAVEHQQGQGGLCRVGVYDDVTESSEVLVTQKRRTNKVLQHLSHSTRPTQSTQTGYYQHTPPFVLQDKFRYEQVVHVSAEFITCYDGCEQEGIKSKAIKVVT